MRCTYSHMPRAIALGGLALLVAFLFIVPTAFADDSRQLTSAAALLSDGKIGNGKAELRAQRLHSSQVVAFFTTGPHRWLTFSRHRTCGDLGPRAKLTCQRARDRLAAHRWLLEIASGRLDTLLTQEQRNVIVRRLEAGLSGYPLASYAADFEAAGRAYNVSPYFMAAISGTESTYGLHVSPGNAWGIGPGMYFPSFREGIWYLAKMLHNDYDLSNTWTVGSRYCCSGWGSTTGSIMQSRFGASPYSLAYPSRE